MSTDSEARQEALLRAIVALLVEQRPRPVGSEKLVPVELLLSDAGLDYHEVALVTGKKPDAVRMAISRRKQTNG